MVPVSRLVAKLLILAASLAQAQGGSAVVTLAMPPPGGEGFSMLQNGGMFANGATSTYYNPALLSDLERQTGSQLHYTQSRQQLLPVLGLTDLFHEFQGVAAVFPDREGGTDLGIGFFRNHVSFGENQQTDQNGQELAVFDSYETVYGAGIGVRLGLPVSLGGAVKFLDSRLAQGMKSSSGARMNGMAQSWAFDLGALANPRFILPASFGLPYIFAAPSFSAAVKNMGPDVFYDDVRESDPIPTSLVYGLGLRADLSDLVDIEAAWSVDREIHRRPSWSDTPVWTAGASLGLLGFRFSVGWLKDDPGKRFEKHTGRAFDLDMLKVYRVGKRFATGDFISPPDVLEAGYPFGWTEVMGFPFRANPRFVIGWREIDGRRGSLRDGQKAFFTAVSL